MTASEIRESFVKYFAGTGHTVVPSSSLLPKDDPTLLFTNAGMVQFKSAFLDESARAHRRAVSCQKCMRAGGKHNDLENVGRTARHHTFFEMLGNFSFGDYFKAGAIEFAWGFLTGVLGLPSERLWATVFEDDAEAALLWRKITGLPEERIVKMGARDNFWSMGETGPCGPCSEIIIDQGADAGCGRPSCAVGCDCDRFLELWNLVFMQYDRDAAGALTELPSPCIDTGMGLERLSAVMQGKKTNYESDLFAPLIGFLEGLTSVAYGSSRDSDVSLRAIADHSRAITFLISDGVLPSNEGRGYVLRRIIRRAARHGRALGIKEPFLYRVNSIVADSMAEAYPELSRARETVARATRGEEERFFETLERGLSLLGDELRALREKKASVIPGSVAFRLYDTYGFPSDLTADIVRRDGFTVDEDGFNALMDEQKRKARLSWKGVAAAEAGDVFRRLSGAGLGSAFVGYHMEAVSSRILCIIRDGAVVEDAYRGETVDIITEETPFYAESGGQAGDTGDIVGKGFSLKVADTRRPAEGLIAHRCTVEEGAVSAGDAAELVPDMERRKAVRRNHTATHLIHAALRRALGEHVRQAGSYVGPDRLRFDFSHFEPIGHETLRKIEDDANGAVLENIAVKTDVIEFKEAVERGALAFFGEKYGDTVRMVSVPGVSVELCGGTHAAATGEIGLIKIAGESSVASGVRRIEALTGEGALAHVAMTEEALRESARMLKAPRLEVPDKIKKLLERQRELEREIDRLKGSGKALEAATLLDAVREVDGVKVLAARVEAAGPRELRDMADALRGSLGSGIVVLGSAVDGKALLLAAVTRDLAGRFSAGEIIKRLAPLIGGRGGGKDDMAQAGGSEPDGLDAAVKEAIRAVREASEGLAGGPLLPNLK
jgi:alanyl-tRNA synthetase